MPASGVFPADAPVDLNAAIYGVELASNGTDGALRADGGRFFFASKVILQAGSEPSYAVAEIPLTDFEETAPAIAAVPGGAMESIKIGTRARVFVNTHDISVTLLYGSVVNIQQDLASDGATLTIFDDRWLLQGVPVAGNLSASPAAEASSAGSADPRASIRTASPIAWTAPAGHFSRPIRLMAARTATANPPPDRRLPPRAAGVCATFSPISG